MTTSNPEPSHVEEIEEACTIPSAPSSEVLQKYVLGVDEDEQHEIAIYVEWQASGETVKHLEKVKSERVIGRDVDVWDVWTDKSRYWVLTGPTNLYVQEDWTSLDYLISFHIGLMARVSARREATARDSDKELLPAAWRRWEQAFEALDRADEAEEFQAVGMRCRECLLEFIQFVAKDEMVPENADLPKKGDFVHWAEFVADTIAKGASSDRVRGYLKTVSKSTWELVNWLTHSKNAVALDAHLAIDATKNVLDAFGAALVRHERDLPDRCPNCSSYKITARSLPEHDPPYVASCKSCDWVDVG